jgi:mRNA-degrading endonuclease RelE of RelBE toxin-antitoxin system
MSWDIAWSDAAVESLQRIPSWRDAARVDAAVQRFAATGEGDVARLPTDHATTLRLRVGPYTARLTLNRPDKIVFVWIVYLRR